MVRLKDVLKKNTIKKIRNPTCYEEGFKIGNGLRYGLFLHSIKKVATAIFCIIQQ